MEIKREWERDGVLFSLPNIQASGLLLVVKVNSSTGKHESKIRRRAETKMKSNYRTTGIGCCC